ncbi:hypothetical protein G7067_10875 [Leucobacter insecticola]|uniref:T6SS immunity protein Tdi1 C-terminal domain-containing protein n=1 Tax=Leucobacter insecticola TaxID=2714934 RepID=A0A6G8FKA5_9MICO|nr:hypothetical protein [Leucobacter insecticola]QIM16791.1 hypothetical protein G7067_10875 [Leucobacter insecticola]
MSALVVDENTRGNGGPYVPEGFWSGYADAGYCGASFNGGLVRFHDDRSGPLYRAQVLEAFPELPSLADVLAVDWHGRQIVTNGSSEQLLLADPSTGKTVEWYSVEEFSTALRLDGGYAALNGELFDRWREFVERPGGRLPWEGAVAYAVPLYAGGESGVECLEFTDLDVLWDFTVQVLDQVRDLPPGTPIKISM